MLALIVNIEHKKIIPNVSECLPSDIDWLKLVKSLKVLQNYGGQRTLVLKLRLVK